MTPDAKALDLLDDLLTRAKAAGAEAADAVLFDSVSLSHAQRLGELERLVGKVPYIAIQRALARHGAG